MPEPELPDVRFGDEPPDDDWVFDDADPDDEEIKTPKDVIDILGFDPAEI